MKESKALDNGLAWIKEHLCAATTPSRDELRELTEKAASQFNVDVNLMQRKAECSIVHTVQFIPLDPHWVKAYQH